MPTPKKGKGIRRPNRRIMMVAGLGVLWLGALFLVAVPETRSAIRNHQEVQALEIQLADLDSWTVAGKWLAPEVDARGPAIELAWDRTFPDRRQREDLFLDIAQIADASGLVSFDLKEMRLAEDESGPPRLQESLEAYLGGDGSINGMPVDIPRIDLATYRLKASFLAGYGQVAEFLGGLHRLNRAMSVHNLVAQMEKGKIQVELEMDIYVSKSS